MPSETEMLHILFEKGKIFSVSYFRFYQYVISANKPMQLIMSAGLIVRHLGHIILNVISVSD
jgi:hypothetical protein